MAESAKFVLLNGEDMEDFHDYEDEEQGEIGSKLDEYEEIEEDDDDVREGRRIRLGRQTAGQLEQGDQQRPGPA